jgi:chorismate dehydratase
VWKTGVAKGEKLQQIRIGVPEYISVRPLIYGLTRRQAPDLELVYHRPSVLADLLSRGSIDAALIPSIEYLRGVGEHLVDGPALVTRATFGNVVLLVQKPLEAVARIAVSEFCRSPVAALRVVLSELHGVSPDLCVSKSHPSGWREQFDGVLLSDDGGLQFLAERPTQDIAFYNISEMWGTLTSSPLVLDLWAYNDERLKAFLSKVLVASRNLGIQNLSHLADGIARMSPYHTELLYDYLSNCWDYQLSEAGLGGLRALESFALRYDLVRRPRFVEAPTG